MHDLNIELELIFGNTHSNYKGCHGHKYDHLLPQKKHLEKILKAYWSGKLDFCFSWWVDGGKD